MAKCACGCRTSVSGKTRNGARRYVSGHNLVGLIKTDKHRAGISAGQRAAWQTKRQRLPVGSTNHDSHGYVRVKVVEGAGRWMPQHKLVMERMIGRPLKVGEVVHHINGVRDDNRPDNLYLCRDHRHHQEVEGSLAVVFRQLLAAGFARFNEETGRYEQIL